MANPLPSLILCAAGLLFLANSTALLSEQINARKPDDTLLVQRSKNVLVEALRPDRPGAAILISKGNRMLYEGARGQADAELDVPLSTKNVFAIASLTKMFTAAMVLKLAEQHQLSLSDPLLLYLPDFPKGQDITIQQILRHTSGISDTPVQSNPRCELDELDTKAQIAEIRVRPLDFAPGTHWRYSNAGFIVLGAVIEKVTGQPWYQAITLNILQPLGLTHTYYAPGSTIIPGRAHGYSTGTPGHVLENARPINVTIPAAAGALTSTTSDLRLWMRALASGKVISAESFKQMSSPGAKLPGSEAGSSYGLGTYVWNIRGHTVIGHTGSIGGFTSFVGYIADGDEIVVVLANDDDFDAQTVGRRLVAIALGQPYAAVTSRPPSTEDLHSLPGNYRIDESTVETISVKDNHLYAQRTHHNLVPLQVTVDGDLHFVPDELSYLKPDRDKSGQTIRLDYFSHGEGPAQPFPRQ